MATTYEPIQTVTVATAATTFSFTSIPQTYTDLVVVIKGGDSRTGGSDSLTIRFNSDSGANYSNTDLVYDGSTVYSSRYSGQTIMRIAETAGSDNGLNSVATVNIFNYKNTSEEKTAIGRSGIPGSGGGISLRTGMWNSTAAITSINFLAQGGAANWTVGTTATLYGIKAA